jgi:hypothetical protein
VEVVVVVAFALAFVVLPDYHSSSCAVVASVVVVAQPVDVADADHLHEVHDQLWVGVVVADPPNLVRNMHSALAYVVVPVVDWMAASPCDSLHSACAATGLRDYAMSSSLETHSVVQLVVVVGNCFVVVVVVAVAPEVARVALVCLVGREVMIAERYWFVHRMVDGLLQFVQFDLYFIKKLTISIDLLRLTIHILLLLFISWIRHG